MSGVERKFTAFTDGPTVRSRSIQTIAGSVLHLQHNSSWQNHHVAVNLTTG